MYTLSIPDYAPIECARLRISCERGAERLERDRGKFRRAPTERKTTVNQHGIELAARLPPRICVLSVP